MRYSGVLKNIVLTYKCLQLCSMIEFLLCLKITVASNPFKTRFSVLSPASLGAFESNIKSPFRPAIRLGTVLLSGFETYPFEIQRYFNGHYRAASIDSFFNFFLVSLLSFDRARYWLDPAFLFTLRMANRVQCLLRLRVFTFDFLSTLLVCLVNWGFCNNKWVKRSFVLKILITDEKKRLLCKVYQHLGTV